jgi:hypothetical protein
MKSLVATSKWLMFVILAVGTGILLLVLRHLFAGPQPESSFRLPDIPPVLRQKVEQAQEDALRIKLESRIMGERDAEEIERILAVSDGAERRKRLAEKLRSL